MCLSVWLSVATLPTRSWLDGLWSPRRLSPSVGRGPMHDGLRCAASLAVGTVAAVAGLDADARCLGSPTRVRTLKRWAVTGGTPGETLLHRLKELTWISRLLLDPPTWASTGSTTPPFRLALDASKLKLKHGRRDSLNLKSDDARAGCADSGTQASRPLPLRD